MFSILPLEEMGVDGFSGNKTLSTLKCGHEFEQTPGDSGGQAAWHASVFGVSKSWT